VQEVVAVKDPAQAIFSEPKPPQGADALFDTVYARLKAMAGRQLAGARDTLDTTALVHELYLRCSSQGDLVFAHPAQFFAYAARAMRNLLINRARDRMSMKAGGQWQRTTLTDGDERLALDTAEQALMLERALTRLEQTDARAAHVVELRYFAGLTLEQVAENLQLARRTIDRDWRFARAFLKAEFGAAA
jgi:RNA polymerase sigma factor (TIGR02999 family)